MKKFKWLLILWVSVLLCSCRHYLTDKPGIVMSVKKLEHDEDKWVEHDEDKWEYEVIISGQDASTFRSRYCFYTNQLYQVGDTIYIGQIYNQTKDTIQ